MDKDAKITALDRGLVVIEFFLGKPQAQRFSEVKELFPGITDTTLSRLLKSLVASQHLKRSSEGLYEQGEALKRWHKILICEKPSPAEIIANCVKLLSWETGCSASWAALDKNHLAFHHTDNVVGSLSLGPHGIALYFEADHAASLCFLNSIDERQRRIFIEESPYSKIKDYDEYSEAIQKFSCGSCFKDESRTRIGMSRFAINVKHEDINGVLFIGLSTAELMIREKELHKALNKISQRLLKELQALSD
ncbi:MAG: winged helix-turn-helix transcriptional regulator [Lentisphaeraceae bacterium]|nr:winged helix-turn-helix transcriptional regulator [Lentisphaeraceae bacterium]